MLRVVSPLTVGRVALLLLCAAGCNKGNAPKLEGRWRGIKATGVTPDQLTAANLFASKMELEFHGALVSVHNGDDKQSSPFHVVSDDKGTVVIAADADGAQSREAFTFTDDKTIDWAIGPSKTIQFVHE
jgi:hypothetical protein